ncbi:conserved hypothetical protein [Neospora caninum Liverpool]|nr:conserved hypothetical protein [Neospora caninum Liverpool]CBZ56318.1 conserved hypothetical protein [Neospora caninum Liverpool]|eukprot:XP_003886343.1 conserved hypothetical protein [Neospora caninum Liverpool]
MHHATRHNLTRSCPHHSPTSSAQKCSANQILQGITSSPRAAGGTAGTRISGDRPTDVPDCCRGRKKPGFAEELSTRRQAQFLQSPAARVPDSILKDCILVEASHPHDSVSAAKRLEGPRQVRGGIRVSDGFVPSKLPSPASEAHESVLGSVSPALLQPDSSPFSAKSCHFHNGPAHRPSGHQLNGEESPSMQNLPVLQPVKEGETSNSEKESSRCSQSSTDKHLQPRTSDDACVPRRLGAHRPRAAQNGDLVRGSRYWGSLHPSAVAIICSEQGGPNVEAAYEAFHQRNHRQRDEGFDAVPGDTGDTQGISSPATLSSTSLAHVHIPDGAASASAQGDRECRLSGQHLKSGAPTDLLFAFDKADKEKDAFRLRSRMQSPGVFDTLSSSPIPSERLDGEECEDAPLINEICAGSEFLHFSLQTGYSQHERNVVKESLSSGRKAKQMEHPQNTDALENHVGTRIDFSGHVVEASQQVRIEPNTNLVGVGPGFLRKTRNEIGDVHHHSHNQCEHVGSDDPDANVTAWMKLQQLRELLACIQHRQKQRLQQQHANTESPALTILSTRAAIQAPPDVLSSGAQEEEKARVPGSPSIC